MQTTQKKKLSKSAWLLIFIIIGGLVTVSVLAVIGYISLQFVADGITSYMMIGASSWMMGTLLIALPFLGGVLFFYFLKVYIIGNKTTGVMPGGGYSPTPSHSHHCGFSNRW